MAEHTPGPLIINGPSRARVDMSPTRHYAGDYAILDVEGEIIGEAYHIVGHGIDRPAQANARLWAAAPALLAAAELLLNDERLGTLVTRALFADDQHHTLTAADLIEMVYPELIAAIATARGAVPHD